MTKRDKAVLVWGGIVFVAILVGGFFLAGTYLKDALSQLGFFHKVLCLLGFVLCDFAGYVAAYFIGYKLAVWLSPKAVITTDKDYKFHKFIGDVIGYLFIYIAAMAGVVYLFYVILMKRN